MARFTRDVPKALIPVLGRPFAERQLEWLVAQGVTEVVYSIGYRGDLIRSALGDGSRWQVRLCYVDEGGELRGTAGALRLAADEGVLDEAFFVLYGDSFLSVDLGAVWEAFLHAQMPALMTVMRNEGRWDRSNAAFADGRVLRYDKNAPPADDLVFIDYGLSVLTRRVVADEVAPGAVADLATLFHRLGAAGRLAGFEVMDRFYEVGSEEGLGSLERHLRETASRHL
jgi:NDP-sugar pyrophosphorylase family protein